LQAACVKGLLKGVSRPQHGDLVKRPADYLDPHGEPAHPTARQAHARKAAHVEGRRVDVHEVHLKGIIHLLSGPERRAGRDGRQKAVHMLEGAVKVFLDQPPYLLGLEVIGVVIARGEDITPKHYSTLDLRAESFTPGGLVHFCKIGAHG